MQEAGEILDLKSLETNGIEWISRPTGGRAVLHWNDLTYSCAFSSAVEEMGTTIGESYSRIGACLMAGLRFAGIETTLHASSAEHRASCRNLRLPCFLAPNRNELMTGRGKKLIGSAQKRTSHGVLQHGTIPIDGSFRRLPDFMQLGDPERARLTELLRNRCACIAEIVPSCTRAQLTDCIIRGFRDTLPCVCREEPWNDTELLRIAEARV